VTVGVGDGAVGETLPHVVVAIATANSSAVTHAPRIGGDFIIMSSPFTFNCPHITSKRGTRMSGSEQEKS
jgi:hypothetical protein